MRWMLAWILVVVTVGAGCELRGPQQDVAAPERTMTKVPTAPPVVASAVVLPIDGNVAGYHPTYKRFGEYFEDRFRGYHIGEDSEIPPADLGPGEEQEVSVRAIADGVVRHADWVKGYGGVVVIAHTIGGERVNAIYGHLDIASVRVTQGAAVARGDVIGVLGAGGTKETDGERQHLHFALSAGDELRLNGYERDPAAVRTWINPNDFFIRHSVDRSGLQTSYSALIDPQGKRIFHLDFTIPDGWDVEYIPSLQAINLYAISGEGTARERSKVLIRYFDASDFLTLSTVNILNVKDLTVGKEGYTARRYIIEKKSGVSDFKDQPAWRNVKHTVTDFRDRDGRTRYYVVAKNPSLDPAVYDSLLASMRIIR